MPNINSVSIVILGENRINSAKAEVATLEIVVGLIVLDSHLLLLVKACIRNVTDMS